jgi:cobalt-zinc-cadmium efflux system outer membrane protein
MLTISQPLPLTGRRGLEVSAARARVEASSFRAADQIRRARADLRLAFTDLWASQERERELTRSRERLTELAEILARREAAGEAAGFDRLRAEREVGDIESSRAIAMTERRQAQAILASFFTEPPEGALIEAIRPSSPTAGSPPLDELLARAEAVRGDLLALVREAESASFAERAAARRLIPEPEIAAGTKTSDVAGGDVGSVVSVHVALPIFDRARPERAAAEAWGRQVRAEADVLRQTIRAQVVAWRAAAVERRAMAERHRVALVEGADQIVRIAEVSYEAGERGILELLDAYRTASAARLRQTDLDAGAREAEIELEFVSVWEMP